MKKTVKKEATVCDVCGAETYAFYGCLHCGKDYCYECQKKHCVVYTFAVFFQGSDDGCYCKECDIALTDSGLAGSERHAAYRRVAELKAAYIEWNEAFKARQTAAEATLKKLS